MALTVAICTDDPVWGAGIGMAVRGAFTEMDFEVCVGNPHEWEAWLLQQGMRAGVVLIEWTPETLLDSIRNILKMVPALRVVLWGRCIPVEFAYQAAQSGVCGVLRRPCALEELGNCVRVVAANGTWFDESLLSAFLGGRSVALTRRESQLVSLLAHGLKNKEIAAALNVSEGTVKVYMSKLFQKLKVKDRFELALYGLRNLMTARSGKETASTSRILLPGGKTADSVKGVPSPGP